MTNRVFRVAAAIRGRRPRSSRRARKPLTLDTLTGWNQQIFLVGLLDLNQ